MVFEWTCSLSSSQLESFCWSWNRRGLAEQVPSIPQQFCAMKGASWAVFSIPSFHFSLSSGLFGNVDAILER